MVPVVPLMVMQPILLVAAAAAAVPTDPKAAAAAMLAKMTLDEKISMLHGGCDGNCYIGNTHAIQRLGIPRLTMNDGPQGGQLGCTSHTRARNHACPRY